MKHKTNSFNESQRISSEKFCVGRYTYPPRYMQYNHTNTYLTHLRSDKMENEVIFNSCLQLQQS